MSSFAQCTDVSDACPISATTYGYRPNLAANTLFLVIFALCAATQLFLGLRYRLKAFLCVTVAGCLLEAIGYIGRLLMHSNPWSQTGFRIQIICIILGPSFLAAGIYLTLKHLVIHFGSQFSRLPARLYPGVFVGCDAVSIIVQAAGGGLAAAETANLLTIGDDMIIAGIAMQVATMALCWILAIDFMWRLSKNRPGWLKTQTPGFVFYLSATALAFLTILIRCIYRLPEMAGGWGSSLQRDEPDFLILDGTMIAIAAILMTVAHPGIFFPQISSKVQAQEMALEKREMIDA